MENNCAYQQLINVRSNPGLEQQDLPQRAGEDSGGVFKSAEPAILGQFQMHPSFIHSLFVSLKFVCVRACV